MPTLNSIAAMADDMAEWRRHLHRHPELSLDCHETAAFVVARLRDFGVDTIETGVAVSGVVAVIEGRGPGPVTALRADMDALPMTEETGAAWASTVPGRMHACGHDGHTTMLLGAARYLCETRNFRGRVVLLFQPAEETVGGGRMMVEEGVMDRHGVEEVYALHTDPFGELGEFRTCPGPIMAAVDDFRITLTGQGGHAAYPNMTRDPMPGLFALGQALQTLAARETDPLGSLVVSVTMIGGGTASNIIPESAWLGGTVRTLTDPVRAHVARRIPEIAEGIAAAHGLRAGTDYRHSYPSTVNHAAQTAFAAQVAREVSSRVIDDLPPEMGAEDFSYMLRARPGCFLFLGQGIGPSVHHPAFDFNDAAAPYGASFFARLVERRHG